MTEEIELLNFLSSFIKSFHASLVLTLLVCIYLPALDDWFLALLKNLISISPQSKHSEIDEYQYFRYKTQTMRKVTSNQNVFCHFGSQYVLVAFRVKKFMML